MRFSIIIPNYNSEMFITRLLDSIKNQTFKDYEVIIVDDMSTDNSLSVIRGYINKTLNSNYEYMNKYIKLIELDKKRYNGGTRNAGVEEARGDYILFADCDDWFFSNTSLEAISKVIDRNPNIDLVRLSYAPCINGEFCRIGTVRLHENTLEKLVDSIFVAPWLKCIRRDLFVPFPENTLCEDVVQHIAQIDNIERFVCCDEPIMVWNRDNPEAISADGKVYERDSKRFSSIYRQLADLLDLRCKHGYCETERQKRIDWYLDKIHKSEEGTIVRTA